jgi:hypothetical protein
VPPEKSTRQDLETDGEIKKPVRQNANAIGGLKCLRGNNASTVKGNIRWN